MPRWATIIWAAMTPRYRSAVGPHSDVRTNNFMSLRSLRSHSGMVQTREKPQLPLARRVGLWSIRFLLGLSGALAAIAASLVSAAATYEPSRVVPPAPVRGFRAAWVDRQS